MNTTQSTHKITQIRGIGLVKKRWLYAIEIKSIEQLADCCAAEIEERLKAIGHAVAASEIENWITQAQDFLRTQATENQVPENQATENQVPENQVPEIQASNGSNGGKFSSQLESSTLSSSPIANSEASGSLASPSWKSVATLQVELQQRSIDGSVEWRSIVRHNPTQTIALWTGVSLDQFQQWIQQEIRLSSALHAQPIEIEIAQVRLWDSPHTAMTIDRQHRVARSIAANALFHLELELEVNCHSEANVRTALRTELETLQVPESRLKTSRSKINRSRLHEQLDKLQSGKLQLDSDKLESDKMQIDGTQENDLEIEKINTETINTVQNQQWAYRIQCQAKHLGTGQTFCLGDLAANVSLSRNTLYKSMLENLSVPVPGVYRLQICLTSESRLAQPAVFKIPFLQVDAA